MSQSAREQNLLEAIAVTAEMIGAEITARARMGMVDELAPYEEKAIIGALHRCRRELRGRMTLGDIIDRLDDGRPGPEEAWSLYPKDEDSSAIVTVEMQQAMSSAWNLVQDGDKVAARMAFLEAYKRLVAQNRANHVPVKWEPTFGRDQRGREAALLTAYQNHRLTLDRCLALLPNDTQQHAEFLQHAGVEHKLLAAPSADQNQNRARIAEILSGLNAAGGAKKREYKAVCACELAQHDPVPPICNEGKYSDENFRCAECNHAARCHLKVPMV